MDTQNSVARGDYMIRRIMLYMNTLKVNRRDPVQFTRYFSVISVCSWDWKLILFSKFQHANMQVRDQILSLSANFNTHQCICVQEYTPVNGAIRSETSKPWGLYIYIYSNGSIFQVTYTCTALRGVNLMLKYLCPVSREATMIRTIWSQ